MMLTRSFISSYLLTSFDFNEGLIEKLESGLETINSKGTLRILVPSEEEKIKIKTTIEFEEYNNKSYYDFVCSIFDDLDIPNTERERLYKIVQSIANNDFDYDNVKEIIEFSYKKMSR